MKRLAIIMVILGPMFLSVTATTADSQVVVYRRPYLAPPMQSTRVAVLVRAAHESV